MCSLDWGFNPFLRVVYAQKNFGDLLGIPQIYLQHNCIALLFDCWSILLHVYVMEGGTRGLGLGDCMTMGLWDWDCLPLGLQDCQQKAKKSRQARGTAYPTHANNFRFRFRAAS
jgi:hypothetical protein